MSQGFTCFLPFIYTEQVTSIRDHIFHLDSPGQSVRERVGVNVLYTCVWLVCMYVKKNAWLDSSGVTTWVIATTENLYTRVSRLTSEVTENKVLLLKTHIFKEHLREMTPRVKITIIVNRI
jgi:hypothetical protein